MYEGTVRWAPLLVFVVLAAGCGGGGDGDGAASEPHGLADKTLPVDTYVRRADDICRDTVDEVLALRRRATGSPTADQAADLLEEQLRIVRRMRARLEALGAPEGKRAVAEEFIADIVDAEPHLEKTIAALRAGDKEEANAAARRYRDASLESARQVQESGLDFEVCGSGA